MKTKRGGRDFCNKITHRFEVDVIVWSYCKILQLDGNERKYSKQMWRRESSDLAERRVRFENFLHFQLKSTYKHQTAFILEVCECNCLSLSLSLSYFFLTSFSLLSHYLHSFNLVFHISSSERKYSLKRGQSNTWAETGKKKAERCQAGDYIT